MTPAVALACLLGILFGAFTSVSAKAARICPAIRACVNCPVMNEPFSG